MAGGLQTAQVGAVAIGRNEGARLDRCLASLTQRCAPVVYVDSASTDESLAIAARHGVTIVNLDMSKPFTAARARNEGYAALKAAAPDGAFVQFIDGDCELQAGWLEAAAARLTDQPSLCAVAGRRRERFATATPYNQLCDIEWDTPVGPAKAFGGDVLLRRAAFDAVGGFRADLIAGEEPELGVRLRQAGWAIERIDVEMTLHDAAMTRFGQWWKRTQRAGYAYALGAFLHGAPPERHWVTETRRIIVWGGLALAILLAAVLISPWALLALSVYPLQVARIALKPSRAKTAPWLYAAFTVLAYFPQAQGAAKFWLDRWRGRQAGLIEYK
jgi:GT2 family glycosyltransferase